MTVNLTPQAAESLSRTVGRLGLSETDVISQAVTTYGALVEHGLWQGSRIAMHQPDGTAIFLDLETA